MSHGTKSTRNDAARPAVGSGGLVRQIGSRFYGVRPPGCAVCPYCGRRITEGLDNRSYGFRKSAHRTHVFACYEKELRKLGWEEGVYVARHGMHVLHRLPNTQGMPRAESGHGSSVGGLSK